MNCPICNTEIQIGASFCTKCGFEIHILPESASKAVVEYEESRITNYKKIWGTLEEGQGIKGFLVVMMDEESLEGGEKRKIKDIFPVYQGRNVFGNNPEPKSETHIQRIMYCKEMQVEHFAIEWKPDNTFTIQNLSGISYLRNNSNLFDNKEIELYNGDEIFIGNLVFVFIVK